jgi:hypothetical protein
MMDAAGLITARDGIAEQLKVQAPKPLSGNKADNMKRWDPQSRAVTIEAELLSRLLFVESTVLTGDPAPLETELPKIEIFHVSGGSGGVNGGVKTGHRGGAKVGQFGASKSTNFWL